MCSKDSGHTKSDRMTHETTLEIAFMTLKFSVSQTWKQSLIYQFPTRKTSYSRFPNTKIYSPAADFTGMKSVTQQRFRDVIELVRPNVGIGDS